MVGIDKREQRKRRGQGCEREKEKREMEGEKNIYTITRNFARTIYWIQIYIHNSINIYIC